ncbi:hypothetical protein SAMN05421749_103207 [Acinetobacter marinus]|uniref:DUF6160 domain-containing protein n=1 Tax=Acinetobacter marinus TaxID=281375 RepID=A0A1G6J3J1_9GAMM|nr:DUF6160 family protein [Acinetobacter marinus]SDC12526.1 hypothetical protein SAMN05421749_103207 [Acinetobacter marinus]
MKLFSKIALVSAMAISANAMALESMDDEALSAATGQDGITVTVVTSGITIDKLLIHDNDGLDSSVATNGGTNLGGTGIAGDNTTGAAGAIVVNDVTVGVSATQANPLFGGALARITIDTDSGAGGGATGNPFLNINMKNNGIDIGVGSIAVAASNDVSAMVGARRGAGAETEIISGLDLTVGASEMNIQLGAQPQGAMIVANGTIQGGLTINSLDLVDTVAGGDISIGGMKITSENNANLVVNTKISVLPDTHATGGGLSITSTGAKDLYIDSLALGNDHSIGSIEVQGLDMGNSSILVSGH